MLISLAQCSQRPIDIIEELDAISINYAKNVHSSDSGKRGKEIAATFIFFISSHWVRYIPPRVPVALGRAANFVSAQSE